MENIILIILLIINTTLYASSLLITLKLKSEPSFSIRSPMLLLLNNLGGFLMTTTFILYQLLDNIFQETQAIDLKTFCNIVPHNYLIFHFLFFFSFALRCDRIIRTCNVYSLTSSELKIFKTNYYRFLETFYSKILGFLMITVIVVTLILNYLLNDVIAIPYNFFSCINNPETSGMKISLFWIIINFLEHVCLITFCNNILRSNRLTKYLKTELIIFSAVWIVYPNVLRVFEKELFFTYNPSPALISFICCCFLWVCLFLNTFIPLIYCLRNNVEVLYEMPPEQLDNFYLFMSNKKCFKSFVAFIIQVNKENEKVIQKCLLCLELYTKILSFRIYFTMEEDYFKVLNFAKKLCLKYFETPEKELIMMLKESSKESETKDQVKLVLERNEVFLEHFDFILVECYNCLKKEFYKYKHTEDFEELVKDFEINSTVQDAMFNVGLLNR